MKKCICAAVIAVFTAGFCCLAVNAQTQKREPLHKVEPKNSPAAEKKREAAAKQHEENKAKNEEKRKAQKAERQKAIEEDEDDTTPQGKKEKPKKLKGKK